MDSIKFLKGLASAYTGLAEKNANTFYYTTDDGNLYLGSIKLSNAADLQAAIVRIAANETHIGDVTKLTTTQKDSLVLAVNELKSEIAALTGGEGATGGISDMIKAVTGDLTTLTTDAKGTLVAAINEVDANADAAKTAADNAQTAANNAKTESVVTVEKLGTAEDGYSHTYVVKQNGVKVGTSINIPKDLVVKSGSYDAATQNIVLVLNNDTEITIPAAQLVDVYNAENAETTMVTVVVDNDNNTVSADLTSGAKASLAKADSALQEASIATGTSNGNITVGSKQVAVAGLKSAAYVETSAFDAAGSASTAESNANTYTDTKIQEALVWGSIE